MGGTLLDDEISFTLAELCKVCDVHAEKLLDMVQEGLIEPQGNVREITQMHWRFSAHALQRVQVALRLERDLNINLEGVAMVLDLLDEVHDLRDRVRLLEYQLFKEE
jgi:chaperone modulatory protein CbpM